MSSDGQPTLAVKDQQANTVEKLEDTDVYVEKVVHTDGTVDYIDRSAVGGEYDELPRGHFRSPSFIGTVVVSSNQRFHVIDLLLWIITNDYRPNA